MYMLHTTRYFKVFLALCLYLSIGRSFTLEVATEVAALLLPPLYVMYDHIVPR